MSMYIRRKERTKRTLLYAIIQVRSHALNCVGMLLNPIARLPPQDKCRASFLMLSVLWRARSHACVHVNEAAAGSTREDRCGFLKQETLLGRVVIGRYLHVGR